MLALLALLPVLALASPIIPGSPTAGNYPPASTTVDSAVFPGESEVGYAGPTATGAEGFALQTSPPKRYAKAQEAFAPVVIPVAAQPASDDFEPIKHWGNEGPRYSLDAGTFGLANATPVAPEGCDLTQVHLLFRHGSRYPSTGESVQTFAAAIESAATNGTFKASGPLSFLNDWTYKLGREILNVFGRQQCYQLGVNARFAYGELLSNYTASGSLPVFRTGSQDRMVETMESFAQGFFGRNAEKQYSLELEIESSGLYTSEDPVNSCPNYVADYTRAAKYGAIFTASAYADAASRLSPYVSGYNLTTTDIGAMINMCAYETLSLGYSSFCGLFNEDEFKAFEYSLDLAFYYGFGPGSGTGAASGKAWIEELVARLSNTPMTTWDSATNSTQDGNAQTFPLGKAFYADATHDAIVAQILTAFNFGSIVSGDALPLTGKPDDYRQWQSSKLVPFNTNLVVQVMSCDGEDKIRFLLNDAVIPVHDTYGGCDYDADGLCSLSTVLSGIQTRLDSIDFDYACTGNYTITSASNLGGLPPN